MTAFDVVDYDDSRRDDYVRLLAETWGAEQTSAATFDWWIGASPEGTIAALAVLDGDVVGAAAHSLFRVRLSGEEQLAQLSVNAVTSPRARGLGIWRTLERHNEERGRKRGSAVALSFANELTTPIFLGPLGWAPIDRRRVWARPLRTAMRARRRAGDDAAPALDRVHDGLLPIARFGPEHDALAAPLRERLGNHVLRDSRTLNWRYLDGPRSYLALTSGDGFAVLGRTRRRGLDLALLMDLVAPPEHAGPLLRGCLAAAHGAAALLAVPSPLLSRLVLARHGFLPTNETLDLIGLGLAVPLDRRAEAWAYTPGDTDFF